MTNKIKFAGQGAIILFIMFIVVILLVVGVTLSGLQGKAITRVVYAETNLRTFYAAQAGLNEALATRIIPRSNIFSIRYAIQNATSNQLIHDIASLSATQEMFNNLSGKTADIPALTPIYPNSGIVLANPTSPPGGISDINAAKKEVIGTYIYKAIGGHTETNTTTSTNKPIGFPTNNITGRVTIYSIGYSILPNNKIDKFGIMATVDFDKTDNDPTNADEIEAIEIGTDPSFISTIENEIKPGTETKPVVERLIAFSATKVYLDVSSNKFYTSLGVAYPELIQDIPDTGAVANGKYPSSISSTYLVGSNPQIRAFFDRAVDPRSITTTSAKVYCTSGKATCGTLPTDEITGFTLLPNMPVSNAVIMLPPLSASGTSPFLKYDCDYNVEFSNVQDFEGNALNGKVTFQFHTMKAPENTPTPTITATITNTPTNTYTPTDTTATPTFTNTVTATNTTNTPTSTNTVTNTATTGTPTNTYTFTDTVPPLPPTNTFTFTNTTNTPTFTYTYTFTNTTNTPTKTYTYTYTNTTNTPTHTYTKTYTNTTNTPTHTYTPTITYTPTATYTPTPYDDCLDESGNFTSVDCWCSSSGNHCQCGKSGCPPRPW